MHIIDLYRYGRCKTEQQWWSVERLIERSLNFQKRWMICLIKYLNLWMLTIILLDHYLVTHSTFSIHPLRIGIQILKDDCKVEHTYTAASSCWNYWKDHNALQWIEVFQKKKMLDWNEDSEDYHHDHEL